MPLVVPIIVQIKPVDVGAEETRLADRHVVYQVVSQRQPIDLCQRLSLIKQVEAARPLSMWCSWRTYASRMTSYKLRAVVSIRN